MISELQFLEVTVRDVLTQSNHEKDHFLGYGDALEYLGRDTVHED